MGRIQNTIAIPIYRVLPYPVTCRSPLQVALLCGFNYTVPNQATAGGHPVDYLNPHSEVQCTYMYILCAMVSLHVYCMAVVYIYVHVCCDVRPMK